MNTLKQSTVARKVGLIEWICKEIQKTSPDIVVLCGNHAFQWFKDIRGALGTAQPVIVHPNALNYLWLDKRKILFVADETEYGRQLYETFDLCRGRAIASLDIITGYLNSSPEDLKCREKSCDYISSKGGEDILFATAFKDIRAWKTFDDNRNFHRDAIIGMRDQLRQTVKAPINADATLIHIYGLSEQKTLLSEVGTSIQQRGRWYQPSGMSVTFISQEFVPDEYVVALKPYIQILQHRSLVKFYPLPGGMAVAAPMVHCSIRFISNPRELLLWARNNSGVLAQLLVAGLKQLKTPNDSVMALAAYDLISLYLDLEFYKSIQRSGLGRFESRLDPHTTCCYYGPELGSILVSIAETISKSDRQSPQTEIKKQNPVQNRVSANVDIGKLLFCKSLMLREFEQLNKDIADPIAFKRTGLGADQLVSMTGISRDDMIVCIDSLCELEWTYPFNRVSTDSAAKIVIDRSYNTTHAGVVGLVAKVIKVLRVHKIPTEITFLNKCLSLTIQATIHLYDKPEFQAVPYKFGKQPRFTIDDFPGVAEPFQVMYLDLFLKETPKYFKKRIEDNEWELIPGFDPKGLDDGCDNIVPSDVFDPQLEKFVEIYSEICTALASPENETATTTTRDQCNALAVVVDMFGSRLPESGLRTISVNLGRARLWSDSPKEGVGGILLLLEAMEEKVKLYKSSQLVFKGVQKFLDRKAVFEHGDRLRARFAYLPGTSLLWDLISEQIAFAKQFCTPGRFLGPLEHITLLLDWIAGEPYEHKRTPLDQEVERFIVSVDMRNSKLHTQDKLNAKMKEYCHRIMGAWGKWFNCEFNNFNGDEGVFCFRTEEEMLGFVGGVWVHLNDLCSTMLPNSGFGVGVAYGRVDRHEIGGQSSQLHGAGVPFCPTSRACSLSKREKRILIDVGDGKSEKELDPKQLFEDYVLKRSRGVWQPTKNLAPLRR